MPPNSRPASQYLYTIMYTSNKLCTLISIVRYQNGYKTYPSILFYFNETRYKRRLNNEKKGVDNRYSYSRIWVYSTTCLQLCYSIFNEFILYTSAILYIIIVHSIFIINMLRSTHIYTPNVFYNVVKRIDNLYNAYKSDWFNWHIFDFLSIRLVLWLLLFFLSLFFRSALFTSSLSFGSINI